MPVVDHHERRQAIAEGVWRVISRDGIAAASVRTVAAEVGLSAGSLRHFFPAQSDLLVYAMRLVVERIEERVAALSAMTSERSSVEERLRQLLPLDEERRIENEVWLAFTAHALVHTQLRDVWDEVHRAQRNASTMAVQQLAATADDATVTDVEARRLHALLDGLAVQAALRPDDATPDHLTVVLGRHLDDLEARRSPRDR